MEQYHRDKPIKFALRAVNKYWDKVTNDPHHHRVGDAILLCIVIVAAITTCPIWISVGATQIAWFYIGCKMERWRATRSGQKDLREQIRKR